MVIGVGILGKLVSSVCYNKQQVCAYLQLMLDELIAVK